MDALHGKHGTRCCGRCFREHDQRKLRALVLRPRRAGMEIFGHTSGGALAGSVVGGSYRRLWVPGAIGACGGAFPASIRAHQAAAYRQAEGGACASCALVLDERTCKFEGMYDVVPIDEKWFNVDIDGRTYLLLPDEEAPQRHLFPAIKSKCPARDRNKLILVQQDNPKPHVPTDAPDIVAAGTADGWNIHMFSQPANSPDLNVLDLGFFASIQAIRIEKPIYGIDKLVAVVVDAYDKMHYTMVDAIFLTLQNVMICILRAEGGNEYKFPHLGKQRLRRLG
ncbi:unnamed protein product [Phytophthora fragariaefolia]|uniref:Unnamed protein product n=1 Tax=Phytophthora fragariaefolia TaxID=1490495 RepID=A0A9W6X699_9STRA|nr:unnamed protein product [Phytophthora fragariaefolia]